MLELNKNSLKEVFSEDITKKILDNPLTAKINEYLKSGKFFDQNFYYFARKGYNNNTIIYIINELEFSLLIDSIPENEKNILLNIIKNNNNQNVSEIIILLKKIIENNMDLKKQMKYFDIDIDNICFSFFYESYERLKTLLYKNDIIFNSQNKYEDILSREEIIQELIEHEIPNIADKFIHKEIIKYVVNAVYDDVVDPLIDEIKKLKE